MRVNPDRVRSKAANRGPVIVVCRFDSAVTPFVVDGVPPPENMSSGVVRSFAG